MGGRLYYVAPWKKVPEESPGSEGEWLIVISYNFYPCQTGGTGDFFLTLLQPCKSTNSGVSSLADELQLLKRNIEKQF